MKSILFVAVLAVLFSSTFAATFNSRIIEGQLSDDKRNVFRCVFDCLYDKIDLSEALRIIGKCVNVEEPLPCFAQEVGEHLYQCVSKCYQNEGKKIEDKPTCAEKVTKAREHFKGLDKEAKKEFVKKLYEGLHKAYPEASRRKIGFFIYTLLFRNVDAEKVCELYKKLFTSTLSVQTVSECEEKVKQVRAHFSKLNLKEKSEFAKKVFEKLVEKYPNVEKTKVAYFVGTLLYQRVEAAKVCELYKKLFEGGDIAVDFGKDLFRCTFNCLYERLPLNEVFRILGKCLNVDEPLPCFAQEVGEHLFTCVSRCFNADKVTEEKPKCEEKVTKVRSYFKGLDREGKKEFIKKLYVGLTTKYPSVERVKVGEFIKKLVFSNDEPSSVCALYKETFLGQTAPIVEEKPKCEEKVTKVRSYFKGLDREGKKEFIKKLYVALTTKYPSVERVKVGEFIKKLVFSNDEPSTVCALYKETFLGETDAVVYNEQTPNKKQDFRCVFDCLYEKLPMNEILRILGKCLNVEDQLPCFAQELGEHLFACVSKCFQKTKVVEETSCPEKVTKVRDHFKSLDVAGKKEFYNKVVAKLREKYPNTCGKKVEFFAASLLFDFVPADVPCTIYKRIFK